jgi:hypothetical protein
MPKTPIGAVESSHQIIAATAGDCPPNKLSDRSIFGQNDARIDIRSIGFAPSDMRLIHQ